MLTWLAVGMTFVDAYHAPDVQRDTQCEVGEGEEYRHLELVNENGHEPSLEYVSVEEEQEDDDGREEDAHILQAATNNRHVNVTLVL